MKNQQTGKSYKTRAEVDNVNLRLDEISGELFDAAEISDDTRADFIQELREYIEILTLSQGIFAKAGAVLEAFRCVEVRARAEFILTDRDYKLVA